MCIHLSQYWSKILHPQHTEIRNTSLELWCRVGWDGSGHVNQYSPLMHIASPHLRKVIDQMGPTRYFSGQTLCGEEKTWEGMELD